MSIESGRDLVRLLERVKVALVVRPSVEGEMLLELVREVDQAIAALKPFAVYRPTPLDVHDLMG